jgi:prepilin-type N-terminal cleavage/methylation domain-containing protein
VHFKATKYNLILTQNGFTLTEMMITIVIVGILSSVALPNYLNQVNRTRQNDVVATISQIQTTIATYADEFGLLPESWADLNDINAVMTDTGPSKENSFNAIKLAGGYYEVEISQNANLFTIEGTSANAPKLNVIACINLTNGASATNKGTSSGSTKTPNCE